MPLVVEAAQALLDGLGSLKNAELMLGDLPWDARHVGRLPDKSVFVGAEEVDEREFLFSRQLGADSHCLGRVGVVDRDRLGLLGRDEIRRLAGYSRVGTALGGGGAKLAELRRVRCGGGEVEVPRLLT